MAEEPEAAAPPLGDPVPRQDDDEAVGNVVVDVSDSDDDDDEESNDEDLLEEPPGPLDWVTDSNDPLFVCPRQGFRMNITATERQQAVAIKAAIEQSPDIDNLTDFDYVQFALVDHDNIERSLERARHFQVFRQEYGFVDTYEEGARILHTFCKLMPQFMLDLAYNREEGNYILVIDIAKFQESSLQTQEDDKILMGTALNIGHFLCPDFFAIRQGGYAIMETEGYNWRQFTMKTRRRIWQEVLNVYPVNVNQLKYFNTGLFANLAASLMKRFLPIEIFSKIQVGCTLSSGGRLDSFYAIPNHDASNQRFLRRVQQCLLIRYDNKRTFRLEEPQEERSSSEEPQPQLDRQAQQQQQQAQDEQQ